MLDWRVLACFVSRDSSGNLEAAPPTLAYTAPWGKRNQEPGGSLEGTRNLQGSLQEIFEEACQREAEQKAAKPLCQQPWWL
jgi:hypothetical protein